jgi:hypothetical protein
MADTGAVARSGVWKPIGLAKHPARFLGVGVTVKSERTQQNRSNESEYGKDRHHLEAQGKVHDRAPSLLKWFKV